MLLHTVCPIKRCKILKPLFSFLCNLIDCSSEVKQPSFPRTIAHVPTDKMDSSENSLQPIDSQADRSVTPSRLNPRARDFTPPGPHPQRSLETMTRTQHQQPGRPIAHLPALHTTPPTASYPSPYLAYGFEGPVQYSTPVGLPLANPQTAFENRTPSQQVRPRRSFPSGSSNQRRSANPRRPKHYSAVYRRRAGTGWPEGHPPIQDDNYNGLHPSKIHDKHFLGESIFLQEDTVLREEDNRFLIIQDPYKSGSFDASVTPVRSSPPPLTPSYQITLPTPILSFTR